MVKYPKHVRTWLAALIDGEGTVMLVRHARGAAALTRQPSVANSISHRPRVGIYNTDPRLMNAIVEATGINRVYAHKVSKSEGKDQRAKTAYEWRLNTSECAWFLPQVIPWLVCKREQATLLVEAVKLSNSRRSAKGLPWNHLKDPIARKASNDQLIKLASEINILNRKGIKK